MKKLLCYICAAAIAASLCGCGAAPGVDNAVSADIVVTDMPNETDIAEKTSAPVQDGIAGYLDGLGLVETVADEDPGEYDFMGGNIPSRIYAVTLKSGDSLYIKKYDSEKTAADEASKYDPDDPSNYAGSVLEYIAPVYLWRDKDEIIELASCDAELVETVSGYCGEPFSYDKELLESDEPAEDIPEGAVDFEYYDLGADGFDTDMPEGLIVCGIKELDAAEETLAGLMNDEIREKLSGYGEDFFKTHSLALVPLYEGNISDGHSVKSAEYRSGELTVDIENISAYDAALDHCLMIIETERLPEGTEISVRRSSKGPGYENVSKATAPSEDGEHIIKDPVLAAPKLAAEIFITGDLNFDFLDGDESMTDMVYISGEEELKGYREKLLKFCDDSKFAEKLDGALGMYDGEYFESRALAMAVMYEPTVSYGHELSYSADNGKTVELEITNLKSDDEAMSWSLIIIETDRRDAEPGFSILRNDKKADGVDFSAEYVRTDGTGYPRQKVIASRKELESYCGSVSAGLWNPGVLDGILKTYTEEWFESNTLVALGVEATSGSIRYEVTGVKLADGGVEIGLKAKIPEIGTDDMAGWEIFVGLSGVKLESGAEVTVKTETENEREIRVIKQKGRMGE